MKEIESHPLLGEWNVKRILSKVNYTLHTDAIRDFIIPQTNDIDQKIAYADEADLLNLALWGCTAKQWREANPKYAEKNLNIRDMASPNDIRIFAAWQKSNSYTSMP